MKPSLHWRSQLEIQPCVWLLILCPLHLTSPIATNWMRTASSTHICLDIPRVSYLNCFPRLVFSCQHYSLFEQGLCLTSVSWLLFNPAVMSCASAHIILFNCFSILHLASSFRTNLIILFFKNLPWLPIAHATPMQLLRTWALYCPHLLLPTSQPP